MLLAAGDTTGRAEGMDVRRMAGWLGALVLAGPALADEAPPEIVVTAPGASDSIALADSAVNAQGLDKDALDRLHAADLANLLDAGLGSVSLSNGTGNPYQNDVSYRGFQATSLLGSPTGLSVWLDGVRMNEPFGATVNWDLIPLNAIASVEIQPGSNPLFGLNTLGGALVLATKNGAEHGGLGVTVQGGSFGRRAAQVEAGGTLTTDRSLDWFVAGNHDEQDGYRWYTYSRVDQVFGKLRWHGADAHAELTALWADTSLDGTQSLPLSMLGTPKAAYTRPDNVSNSQILLNLKGDARLSDGLHLGANLYWRQSNARGLNSNADLGDDCDEGADCTALAPGGTARDLFADSGYDGTLPLHDYTTGIATSLVLSHLAQDSVGGNVLLDIDARLGGLTHDINLGAGFEHAAIRYDQATGLARLIDYATVPLDTDPLYVGGGVGGGTGPLIGAAAVASHSTSATVFVRDLIHLAPRLTLTGSLSATFSRVTLDGRNTRWLGDDGSFSWTGADGATWYNPATVGATTWDGDAGTLVTVSAPDGATAGPEVRPVTGAHNYHRINPAIGLAWNPAPALGLFASYSEAMRAPTAIELACADPAAPCALPTGFNGDPPLRAVVAHSVELGLRGHAGGWLHWNAALYRTLVSNDIQFVFNTSGLGWFANLGKTRRQGFEAGVNAEGRIAQLPASLSASYGYVEATYRDGFIDATGQSVSPGGRIAGIPDQSFKLHARIAPVHAIALGATLIAVAGQYAHGDEANLATKVPGYTLVNLDLRVTPRPRVELFATVNNLFGVHYATFGTMGTNIYTGRDEQFRTPAPGRAVLAGVRWQLAGAARRASDDT